MCFSGLRGTTQEDINAEQPIRPVSSISGLPRGQSFSDPTKQSYHETTLDDLQEHDAPSYGAAKAPAASYAPTKDDLSQVRSHESWHGKKPVRDDWDADTGLHNASRVRSRMSDGRPSKDAPYRDIDDAPKAQKKRARWAEMKPELRKPKQQEAGHGWQSNSEKQQMAQYAESGIMVGKGTGVGAFVQ